MKKVIASIGTILCVYGATFVLSKSMEFLFGIYNLPAWFTIGTLFIMIAGTMGLFFRIVAFLWIWAE